MRRTLKGRLSRTIRTLAQQAADPPPPVLDPVTQFATDAVAGRIVASRKNVQACQRHLHDLRDADAKGLIWNPTEAQWHIDFFPECLTLPEETDSDEDAEDAIDVMPEAGTPFVLQPFQQFIVGSLFGWQAIRVSQKTGARRVRQRFRIAFFQGGKGCGKTPLGAGILILLLVKRGVRGAQLFCAGAMKDQALIPFADCLKMVHASPYLMALIKETGHNLAILATGNFIRPISSDSRSQSGKRVQGAVIEELHEHPNGNLVRKMVAGIKGRPDALIFLPTNTGFDRESVCFQYYDYACQILEGTLINESWFAFVCHLDACPKCHAKGQRQPSDDCADCDDWKVEGPHWLKANPNLGVSIPWQYVRDQVRVAIDVPSERNDVRRLNFCQWTDQLTVFITAEAWARCATSLTSAAFLASLEGRACFIGIDMADKIDLASVVCLFPRPLAHEPAASAAADAGPGPDAESEGNSPESEGNIPDDRPAINCAVDVLPFFWMPAKTLQRRAQEDKIPYPDWEKAGHVTTTPGSLIDHDAIVAFIIDVLAVRYRIRGIGVDQAGAAAVVNKLKRQFGDALAQEVPQGFKRLSEPTKLLEALVVSGNLTHDANPCMAWCLANMAVEANAWREIRPVKITQRKRIDGGVATIDGVERLLATGEPPDPPKFQMIVLGAGA
jgi:phage terminase large subunit-like protein